MLRFIKRLLGQKERIGITLESLESWFENKTKKIIDDTNYSINEIKLKIYEEIDNTKENIKKLENAKLINENIHVKEIQFMEGNRSFYINRVGLFFENLSLPDDNLKESISKIEKEINDLGKSTFKAYQILQHFYEHEAYAIAQNIKSLDLLLNELKSLVSNKKIKEIESIKSDIVSLKSTINEEKELKVLMKKSENDVVELEEEKRKIRYELTKKEQSKDFKEYGALEVEQHKLNEQINDLKEDIHHYFAILEHALKKQSKIDIEYESVINKYLEDPIKALSDDSAFEIIKILKKIEDNINNDSIDLKDNKKEKTIETIARITESNLSDFLVEYRKLNSEISNISEKMKSKSIVQEIEKIKERIQ